MERGCLKILQVNSVCGVGSTGRIVVEIQRLLREQRHESLIVYGRGRPPADYDALRIGSAFSVMVHGVASRLTDRQGFYSAHATRDLIRAVEAFNPDVIHLHNLHGYYLNVVQFADYLARSGVPVVWTLHDAWAFTGHCAYFDPVNCYRWKTGCFECPLKGSYPKSLFLDRSRDNWHRKRDVFMRIRDCTAVVPSEWLGSHVSESFLHTCNLVVIRNGVDTDVFRYSPSSFAEDHGLAGRRILLAVANKWTRSKGLDDVIEVARLLQEADDLRQGDHERHRVVMIGLSNAQMRSMPSWVTGLPHTSSAQALADAYSAADLFINPTHEDNYPTVNLEALACGLPVITYNTGGSAECLVEPRFGRVVQSNCPEEMARTVLSADVRRFDVDESVLHVVSARNQLKRYIDLYQSLNERTRNACMTGTTRESK